MSVSSAPRPSTPLPAPLDVHLDEIFVSLQGEAGEVGRPQVFLRLAGCPLRCTYCDTPRSWRRRPSWELHAAGLTQERQNPIRGEDLQRALLDLCAQYGLQPSAATLAVTGGEPLEQTDFLAAWLPSWPGRVLLETAGLWPDRLARLLPAVHFVSLDWKLDGTLRAGAELRAPRACLELAARAPHAPQTWVKLVLTADVSDAVLAAALREIAAAAPGMRVFLQPATPRGGGAEPPAAARLLGWAIEHGGLALDLRVLPQTHPLLGVR